MTALLALALPQVAEAGKLRRTEAAIEDGKAQRLTRGLRARHSYARALAAEGLAALPPTEPATRRLLACVAAPDERDWVRSACAGTLAAWRVPEAVPPIVNALGEVGAEARYWMAAALHALGGDESDAAILGLASDADLFVSTAAREWSGVGIGGAP